jgi:hypothetical protein
MRAGVKAYVRHGKVGVQRKAVVGSAPQGISITITRVQTQAMQSSTQQFFFPITPVFSLHLSSPRIKRENETSDH